MRNDTNLISSSIKPVCTVVHPPPDLCSSGVPPPSPCRTRAAPCTLTPKPVCTLPVQDQDSTLDEDDKDLKDLADMDIEKLIVVTQAKNRSGRFDVSLTKLIDDGLSMYEAELAEVRPSHVCMRRS